MPVNSDKAKVRNDPKEFDKVDEGMWTVEITDIVLKENVETKWGVKDKFYIYLGVLNDEQRAKRVVHITSTAYNAGFTGGQASALYEFVCAVYGQTVDDKEELDINALIGGRLNIVIKHKEKDGKVFASVDSVLKCDPVGKKLISLSDDERASCMPGAKRTVQPGGSVAQEDIDIDELLGSNSELDSIANGLSNKA
jgi:hypothetical protein